MAIYKIKSVSANKCLNIYGSNLTSLYNNQNVCLWTDGSTREQKWGISSLGSGVYVLSNVDSSFGLNVYRSGSPWNCDVYPISGNATDAKVNFIQTGNYYKIQLAYHTSYYLTAGGTTDGSNVYWAAATNANNQLWNVQHYIPVLRCPLDSYDHISQPYIESVHWGIDYSAVQYTLIKAARAGRVIYIQNWNGSTSGLNSMGHCVYIEHDTGMTLYMHMNEDPHSYVSLNQQVNMGDTIGRVGTTGNSDGYHLHFGYKLGTSFSYNDVNAYYQGTWVNPANYM